MLPPIGLPDRSDVPGSAGEIHAASAEVFSSLEIGPQITGISA